MLDRRGRHEARIAASHPAARRPSATWVAAVALAALAVGCSPNPAPTAPATSATPTSSPLATVPEPTPIGTSAAAPCTAADLKASHGLIEGAAGSRLTTVDLVARIACSVDAFPALGLRDADGAILVGAAAGGPGRIDLIGGDAYESNVRVANWCAAEPAFPLALEIIIAGEELQVTGSSFPEEGDLPPCNGGAGPILEGTAWTAAP
jgi:hypothetical protein